MTRSELTKKFSKEMIEKKKLNFLVGGDGNGGEGSIDDPWDQAKYIRKLELKELSLSSGIFFNKFTEEVKPECFEKVTFFSLIWLCCNWTA